MQLRFIPRVLGLCLFCLLLGTNVFASNGLSPTDYAGNWMMKLDQRTFVVLKLNNQKGHLAGTLSRPEHFQTSDGTSFTQISPRIVTYILTRSSIEQAHLRFTARDPADKTDEDDYDMTLTFGNQATLKPHGLPFDPWTIRRAYAKRDLEVARDWNARRFYSLENSDEPNPEMERIFEEDQKDRQSKSILSQEEWNVIETQDAARRDATRKLLDTGQLHSAKDFTEAAFIFQHSGSPDDYLLGHTLAVIAVAKGDIGATWIAAATLDRYLQSIGKPQIYGTQFTTTGEPTQEPYNRSLISDGVRREMRLPSTPSQEEQLKEYIMPATKPK
jgi:hypothetical protein